MFDQSDFDPARTFKGQMTREERSEPQAFADFFERTFRDVVGFVAIATGVPGIAEESAQEAFTRAYLRWDAVRAHQRPDLWVKRTAMNCAMDAFRRHRHEVALYTGVLAEIRDEVGRLWAERELTQLSPMERAMAILHYQYGHDTATVGTLLGRSPETVRSYLQRLRRRGRASNHEGEQA